ncbi:MAG: hypothetical protein QOI85_407 [Chloroflexota bacterium]|jgi:hypothetical protein|nr:hypothetical protein [Chloroflexota bacterium]
MRLDGAACAVGRIGPMGPWVGFAPTIDDRYALVIGGLAGGFRRAPADADDLLALACAYFEEALDEPPEELAATLGDIGSLVRHVAEHENDPGRRRLLAEAVDAVDDGLAADVTIARLGRALGDGVDATARIRGRVSEVLSAR